MGSNYAMPASSLPGAFIAVCRIRFLCLQFIVDWGLLVGFYNDTGLSYPRLEPEATFESYPPQSCGIEYQRPRF